MKKRYLFAIVGSAFALGATPVKATPIIYGSYYEETATTTCNNIAICTVAFSAAPSTQYITVTNASCGITSQGFPGALPWLSADYGASSNNRFLYLQPTLTSSQNNTYTETINNQITFKVAPGKISGVGVVTSGKSTSITMICTIVGTLSSQ